MDVPGADRVLERPARDGQEPDARPERAPLARRAFEEYATGRYTKEQLLKQARARGLTNRRGRPLTSQAIGMLLRNQLYAGIVDVPEYGVGAKRGDFEPLISEELFYRVQSVLAGRVPVTTPQQLVEISTFKVALREGSARAGLQIALEADGPVFVREFHGNVKEPRPATRCVRTAARVVITKPGIHIGCETDIKLRRFALVPHDVDESLLSGHRPLAGQATCPAP